MKTKEIFDPKTQTIILKHYWDDSDLEDGREVNGDFSVSNILNGKKKEARSFRKIKKYIEK